MYSKIVAYMTLTDRIFVITEELNLEYAIEMTEKKSSYFEYAIKMTKNGCLARDHWETLNG